MTSDNISQAELLELRSRFLCLSTPEVSDALEYYGPAKGMKGIRPSCPGVKMFGPAFTVAKELNDDPGYRKAADYIDEVPSGHVVAIDNLGLETCTCWGGILTAYARKKGLGGTVINGLHRDVEMIRSANYPVFSKGPFMVTGKGRTRLKQLNIPITIGGVAVSPGDILFGDDHGLVVIPQQILPGVLKRAEAVKSTEHEILRLVINEGLPLHLARERLRYNDLTMPCPSSTL